MSFLSNGSRRWFLRLNFLKILLYLIKHNDIFSQGGNIMRYLEINAKNFCSLYFTYSNNSYATFKDLSTFYANLKKGLKNTLKEKNVKILYSNNYIKEMCYEFDNLFEVKNDLLLLKVSKNKIKEELGWLSLDLLVPCVKITEKFFKHNENNLSR